jgi:hypothetical protein
VGVKSAHEPVRLGPAAAGRGADPTSIPAQRRRSAAVGRSRHRSSAAVDDHRRYPRTPRSAAAAPQRAFALFRGLHQHPRRIAHEAFVLGGDHFHRRRVPVADRRPGQWQPVSREDRLLAVERQVVLRALAWTDPSHHAGPAASVAISISSTSGRHTACCAAARRAHTRASWSAQARQAVRLAFAFS